jgi:hypothetical protein
VSTVRTTGKAILPTSGTLLTNYLKLILIYIPYYYCYLLLTIDYRKNVGKLSITSLRSALHNFSNTRRDLLLYKKIDLTDAIDTWQKFLDDYRFVQGDQAAKRRHKIQ